MTRFKRVIIRISFFLLLFLLVATVLSKTVYRLLLPQVNAVLVQTGALDTAVTYRTVIGQLSAESISDSTENADEAVTVSPDDLKYNADLNISFDELKMIKTPNVKLIASIEQLTEKVTALVDIVLSEYDYDSATDRYIGHFTITGRGQKLKPGLPLTIIVQPTKHVGPTIVPLNSVYTDFSTGVPLFFVYEVTDRQTMWGKETYVQKRTVTLSGSDYLNAAVEFLDAKRVACYPTRPLNDGDAVKVVAES